MGELWIKLILEKLLKGLEESKKQLSINEYGECGRHIKDSIDRVKKLQEYISKD
tara:strand:- start:1178 stop:1339 length:162 start_codon:yes stop_codon:yes gene_type:complete